MRGLSTTILLTLCVLGCAPNLADAGPPVGAAVPQGSYTQTCSNIAWDSTNAILTATCAARTPPGGIAQALGAGAPFTAATANTLAVGYCDPTGDISNVNGHLQCPAKPGTWGGGGAVPNGSYQQSCQNWTVTNGVRGSAVTVRLDASCWTYDMGRINWFTNVGWAELEIDLTQCSMSGDIQNHHGQLLCQPTSLSPAPPAPPAAPTHAPGSCFSGYVWRGASPQDLVCVTPQARQQATNDNAAATQRVDTGPVSAGHRGPRPCKSGFVWRQAFAGDDVCVTLQTRDATQADNAAAPAHTYH
jgi:hypothetical protein